ncbi:SDR family NAD(P)-dependent oxidoreductase [Sphingomonas sp. BIUV-7]|uniref:SDR family NAD(P)-dependent oxidoreductase n=1 Tax=Sphingomonas natans TaxID=3063330 RepID=A0ABT8YE03_9SPHN|nr:SDR family NAD(P)-dependent oxidoreductase [Sphingomonas sp. BIUV-7]MDO6416574.1 SDR family NAD(P)-dependent oxidoreductase [Sphingomonas sp. BIUV-7]
MRLVLFGPGYTGARIAAAAEAQGAAVAAFGRAADPLEIRGALAAATHVLSTVAPEADADAILAAYRPEIARVRWIGYLSSTGVYGDTRGAWVDESAQLAGRRGPRIAADLAWAELGARIFRLPGIYGPGRSILDRVRAGQAHRIDLPDQVFSRVHVDDIVGAVLAATMRGAPGIINIADDLPAPQNALVEVACFALGLPLPPLQSIDEAKLSPAARAFYAENRRVANGKAKRELGWRPLYPTYLAGIRALIATTSPATTSAPPIAASTDQT